MSLTTIVIADSVDSCREHLEGFILKNRNDYQLLHTAANATETLYAARHHQPNLVVIDVDLQDMCYLQLSQQVLEHCPHTRLIVRAADDIAYHGRRSVRAGARGVLNKHACNAELKQCLSWVHQGNLHLPAECRHLQLSKFAQERELDDFELEVLLNICLRRTLEQIKVELYACLSRVRRAKDRINALAGTRDRDGILRWAYLHGYISLRVCWQL